MTSVKYRDLLHWHNWSSPKICLPSPETWFWKLRSRSFRIWPQNWVCCTLQEVRACWSGRKFSENIDLRKSMHKSNISDINNINFTFIHRFYRKHIFLRFYITYISSIYNLVTRQYENHQYHPLWTYDSSMSRFKNICCVKTTKIYVTQKHSIFLNIFTNRQNKF